MFVIVAYDVNTSSDGGKARLRKVAKECVNYGQRVQNSVFEINLEYGKFILLKDSESRMQKKKLNHFFAEKVLHIKM